MYRRLVSSARNVLRNGIHRLVRALRKLVGMLIARIASIASTPVEPGPVKKSKLRRVRLRANRKTGRDGAQSPSSLTAFGRATGSGHSAKVWLKLKLAELKSPARNFAELGRRSAPAFPSTAVRRRTKYG